MGNGTRSPTYELIHQTLPQSKVPLPPEPVDKLVAVFVAHLRTGSVGFGVFSSSRATTLSEFIPSASALKFVMMRCRSRGGATAATSSVVAQLRPYSAARAFAPRMRYCDARGPAPQLTN